MSRSALILAAFASGCSFVIDLPELSADRVYNSTTREGQGNPTLAFFANGSWLMVFEDDGTTPPNVDASGAIRARYFDPAGDPIGGDFVVHQNTAGEQEHAAVAASRDVAVVVWDDDSNAPPDQDTAVRGRAFDANGGALGADFLVPSSLGGEQSYPAVGAGPGGHFLATWIDGSAGSVLRARVLSPADGTPLSSELELAAPVTRDLAAAVSASSSAFLVVWTETSGIRARFVDVLGAMLDPFPVSTTPSDPEAHSAVAFDASARRFLVVWTDANRSGIRARFLTEAGVPEGDDFVVNEEVGGNQERPRVSASGDGVFLVAWTGVDAMMAGIRARRIDATGAGMGRDMLINRITLNDQKDPAVAASPNGFFQLLWEDESALPPDESEDSVRGRTIDFRPL